MNQSIRKSAQSGFTLVEVIVVAIIVAALAAVAVPMYANYVTSSRENAAANASGSVASFMGACINQTGVVEGTDISATVETDGTKSASLACKIGTVTSSSMQLPAGIKFKISSFSATGSVEAKHIDSKTGSPAQIYKY